MLCQPVLETTSVARAGLLPSIAMRRSQNQFLACFTLLFHNLPAVLAATPKRLWQSTAYDEANNRIIFLGGASETGENTQEVYSLSLTKAFNRTSIEFESLPDLPVPIADSATVITKGGQLYVIGGTQSDCANSIATQILDTRHDTWTVNLTTGVQPAPRQGARAVLLRDEIFYFGGQSLANCSSNQYYYNSVYTLDTPSNNWSVRSGSLPPVAQSRMTINALSSDSFVLFGGESVSANSKSTWVAMSQLAAFNASTSSWSYASVVGNQSESVGRSGHTSVNNGTHTFIFGGALGSAKTSPKFLSLSGGPPSFASFSLDNVSSGLDNAPPDLYGHTATLTKDGIMIIATGLVGTSTSSIYNDQIYLYDTVNNIWLDVFEPTAHSSASEGKMGIGKNALIGFILGTIVSVIAVCILLLFLRRRVRRKQRERSVQYEKSLAYPDPDIKNLEVENEQRMSQNRTHLPPWAAMHACQARSKSPHIWHQHAQLDTADPQQQFAASRLSGEYDIHDIQFALPSTPRVMAFAAPQVLLRVVNPDTLMSTDCEGNNHGPIYDMAAKCSTGAIESEEDLENMRSHMVTETTKLKHGGPSIVPSYSITNPPQSGSKVPVDWLSQKPSDRSGFVLPQLDLNDSGTMCADLLELRSTSASRRSFEIISSSSSTSGSLRSFSYSPYLDSPGSALHESSPRSVTSYNRLNRKPSSAGSTSSQTSLLWWR